MFFHNFKYTLKVLFRSKTLIFWTFAFPIILGTLFKFAFSNIENSEKMPVIDIAIVDNQDFKENEIFKEVFKILSDENNSNRIFNTIYTSKENANNLLNNNKITGFIFIENNNTNVIVKTNGLNEMVLKNITEEINQIKYVIDDLTEKKLKNENDTDYNTIARDIFFEFQTKSTQIKDISRNNLNTAMIEYYNLIGLTCLYGGIIGMSAITYILPNRSIKGNRISEIPIYRSTIVLSSLLASYLIQLIGLGLLLTYTIVILKVNYGTHLFLTILLALVR